MVPVLSKRIHGARLLDITNVNLNLKSKFQTLTITNVYAIDVINRASYLGINNYYMNDWKEM